MYEEEIYSSIDTSEVVKSSDASESFSEVSADDSILSELQGIHSELTIIRECSLLLFVSFLLVFIFKFLFGQLSAWFSS